MDTRHRAVLDRVHVEWERVELPGLYRGQVVRPIMWVPVELHCVSLVVVVVEGAVVFMESVVVSKSERLWFHGEYVVGSFVLRLRSGTLRALSSLRLSSPLSGSVPLLSSSCVVRVHLLHHLNVLIVYIGCAKWSASD